MNMKTWLLRALKPQAFLCVLALAASSVQAQIGVWNQDETSGNLIDSTGGHPPGVPTGSLTYGQPGVPNGTYGSLAVMNALGTSIEYGPSTSDEFFTIGTDNNNPAMNLDRTGAFTVMGWINPAAPTLAASTYRFFSTGSGAGADRGWGIGLRLNGTTGANSAIRMTTYGIADNDSSPFNVNFGEWQHIAATYNNGAINYFLNGNALDSDTSLFGNDLAAGRLVIGGRVGANDTDQASGLLDGIRIYDRVLSVPEIQQAAVISVSIPEPSSFVLAALACFGLVWWRRRSSKA
ncbi:MAG: LamG-like jellyroll fold domain-containing protein [Pirellulales bacterium]